MAQFHGIYLRWFQILHKKETDWASFHDKSPIGFIVRQCRIWKRANWLNLCTTFETPDKSSNDPESRRSRCFLLGAWLIEIISRYHV
jgi:hypothetical protein